MARGVRNQAIPYLLAHMNDGCCAPWPFAKQGGYSYVWHQGKRIGQAHRMVCEIVNGPPPTPKHHARHLCGKGHLGCFNSGCVTWGTAKDNHDDAVRHGTYSHGEKVGTSKLTRDDVLKIRDAKGTVRQVDLAARFSVSQSLISAIQAGQWWKHVS